jgi:hypothetical protein
LPILLVCFIAVSAAAQQVQTPRPAMPPVTASPPMVDDNDPNSRLEHEMQKKAAKERVAELKSDTDKLVKLSMELKGYVDKSDENVLSLDVIRKAEEIEKLAKSVREKMKGPN